MIIAESGNKMENWLTLSPLLYNRLFIHSVPTLQTISQVKWLRGIENKKSSLSYNDGYVCVSGSTERATKQNKFEGGFCVYKCSIPTAEQLDDDRIQPSFKLLSHWLFREQIDLLEQFSNDSEDPNKSNMFAITYKKRPVLNLLPTKKLTSQGTHPQYAQSDKCIQFQSHTQPITSVKWGSNLSGSHKLFTSSDDNSITQYDIVKMVEERKLNYHRASVKGIALLYDYSHDWCTGPNMKNPLSILVSVASDGTAYLWDNKSPTPVNKINKHKQLTAVESLSHNIIVTGAADGTINLFDIRNLKEYLYDSKVERLNGHTNRIKQIKANRCTLEFDRSGRTQKNHNNKAGRVKFVSSSEDGKIIEWREKLQFSHEGHESSATFDLADNFELRVSAQCKKNILMLWQPGVTTGQKQ